MTSVGVGNHSVEEARSVAMRYLIHYVGDIHQPLHSASLVDKHFPSGDRGGNLFPLHNQEKELHALWDSVLMEYDGYPELPMTIADWQKNGNNAKRIMHKYPETIFKKPASDLNVQNWAEESFLIAKNFVYKSVKEGKEVPERYLEEGKNIAEMRLALAGYRLANLLKGLNLKSGPGSEEAFLQ